MTETTRPVAAHSGIFVNYLPQDEAVAAGFGADEGGLDPVESQRVVDLLNRELSRSRWYDFPYRGAKGIVAGVIVGEVELSRRVFMLLYRISSNKDPGARAADSLSSKDHAELEYDDMHGYFVDDFHFLIRICQLILHVVILQEKKLLDLPKLLDICAIYGHENEDLTRLLVGNALKAQPGIHDNLIGVLTHFLDIVHTMHQRCSSSLEVMDFINDAIVSMDALVSAYKPAAVFFSSPVEMSYGNVELLSTLAQLHDSLLPSFHKGFRIIFTAGEDEMMTDIAISLKMLSMRIVNFGWKLLDLCYLSDEVFEDGLPVPAPTKMFPAKVDDPFIRGDILVQTFREINGVSMQVQDHNMDTFLKIVEKNYNLIRRLEHLQNSGWIFMEDEQFQYLSGIVMYSSRAIDNKQPPIPVAAPALTDKVHMDEDAAIMESKISQIKDLFPDYGKGFLAACLEIYNHNPEEVIQRILENSLHEDLRSLDTSLETMPVTKSGLTVSRKDKGKGKLDEPSSLTSSSAVTVVREQQTESPSVSSSSTVGRYIRKSKADMLDHDTLDTKDEKDSFRTAALISQYEYEDEYDDSFDDLGQSVVESGFEENESLNDKINSNSGKSWGPQTENSAQAAPNSKWGSKKKPQYYVKDGKNYSYKVAGSIAVANANEASLITEAQKDLIYGLGRGGNLPLGAVKNLMEHEEQANPSDVPETEGRENTRNSWGRGKRGGRTSDSHEEQDNRSDGTEGEGRGNVRGRRGGGRRGGGRNNNYRKDRAMNKHFSGVTGF
ncbi:hypothetical protein JRO89_XS07G0086200 [Xanthoceras sorbifolium]|uniref:CUE domain-containing protein n=1 Tax=Xanthoceras sorbifolium TaxID=99658 RepID=A0ABQ8HT42_9ROSI|nr:hypothetical protein JRO89_XS07G0086200 [Xanthoceras sorbifolium]